MNEPLQGSSDLDHLLLKLISDLVSFDTTSRNSNLELIEYVRSYLEAVSYTHLTLPTILLV